MRKLVLLALILIVLLIGINAASKYVPGMRSALTQNSTALPGSSDNVKIVSEESVTIDNVKKYGPAVVTVAEETSGRQSNGGQQQPFNFGPFDFFQPPQNNQPSPA